jgi:hypothetical protein
MSLCAYVFMCMYTCVYLYVYVYMHVCICICMCMCVCVYVCMCVCVCGSTPMLIPLYVSVAHSLGHGEWDWNPTKHGNWMALAALYWRLCGRTAACPNVDSAGKVT